MPRLTGPLLSAGVAAALALASVAGPRVLAAALGIVILLFTLGGAAASGLPAARRGAWLAAVAGLVSLGWVTFSERPDLGPLAATLGPAFVVAIVVQLARRDGRRRLTTAMTFTVAAVALAAIPVLWVALRFAADGRNSGLFGLLGVCAVSLAEAVPVSRAVRRMAGILLATGVATAVAVLVDGEATSVPPVSAVVLTAFAGALTAAAFAAVDRLTLDIERHVRAVEPVAEPVPSAVLDHRPVLVGESGTGDTGTGNNGLGRGGEDDGTGRPGSAHDEPEELVLAGVPALVPMRVTLPVIVAAPAVYILGRLFVG